VCEVMLSEYKKMTIEKISIFWMFPEDLAFSKALTKKFVPMACWAEKKNSSDCISYR